MRKVALFILMITLAYGAYSQAIEGKASITIHTDQDSPAESVTVELLRSADSALIKTELTDKSGKAWFENLAPGSYFIKAAIAALRSRNGIVF